VPIWLLPENEPDGFTDGSFAEKEELRKIFLEEIGRSHDGKEWLDAYEMGRDFRKFMYRLDRSSVLWSQRSYTRWVQDRFDWARHHPGIGCPAPDDIYY
jgi:hypothetical protein